LNESSLLIRPSDCKLVEVLVNKVFLSALLLYGPIFGASGQWVSNQRRLESERIISAIEFAAGPSIATHTGGDQASEKTDHIYGFVVSGSIAHSLSSRWDIAMLCIWEEKGARKTETYVTGRYAGYNQPTSGPPFVNTTSQKVNEDQYLTFSLVPRLAFAPRNRLHVAIGPYYSILKKSHYEYKVTQEGQVQLETKASPDPWTKTTDYGICAGVEIDIPLTQRFNLSAQLRVTHGLFDVSKINMVNYQNVSAGLLIGIKILR
jgi:hypothetical protein